MTIKQIIKDLQDRGYSISFYKRRDGGFRIVRINGERYSGSSGNKKAREIVGATLTDLQIRALSKLATPKGKGSYNKRRKEQLDKKTKEWIQRVQRLYRKAGKKEGKPTIRNFRYIMKTKGKEEAMRLLAQAHRRILGFAYVENVDALLARIASDLHKRKSKIMRQVYNTIYDLRNKFLDKWIPEVYEIIYSWEQGQIDGDTAGNKILAIIG